MPPFHSRSTGAFRQALISSAGVSASTVLGQAQRGPHRLGDRHRLGRPREHPAAGGDQGGVVVGPAGPRQREQPRPLGPAALRVGIGVDEDVPVVERRDQLDVPAEQHAVAEHVAAHVADADAGEVVGLRVHPHLPEVPLHRHPGAAGGDAHGLVVVAGRPTRGERVAQPEAASSPRSGWRCRRTWRCPCPPPPPGTGRRRRSGSRPAAGPPAPSTRLSVTSSRLVMKSW